MQPSELTLNERAVMIFAENLRNSMALLNDILWHPSVLFVVLGVGIVFLFWTKFSPILSLTHGVQVVRGKFDKKNDPGAISHFEALSAALSATVGLGNIGGVAMAISIGGPGAVFWMWVVGFVGMALKTAEVTQAMIFRRVDKDGNPHGGAMYVAEDGFKRHYKNSKWIGKAVANLFCFSLIISTVTGGNMFQAWNVAVVTQHSFGVPQIVSGVIMAILAALVIVGGIKRIGHVASAIVPFMCLSYCFAAIAVLVVHFADLPNMFMEIFRCAFSSTEAGGAFVGGTAGSAFVIGMKRALFSNEAGQGSAPIAHSAAKTDEPVREGIVAGLEPFIDTLIVCTMTALVILATGVWNRKADFDLNMKNPNKTAAEVLSTPTPIDIDHRHQQNTDRFFVVLKDINGERFKHYGTLSETSGGQKTIQWNSPTETMTSGAAKLVDGGIYSEYLSAALTSYAFDSFIPGLGKWLITLVCWLFAFSTVISWSYYGEEGVRYALGQRAVASYRIIYCILIVVATSGFITTDADLDNLTGLGTGVMLMVNIPLMVLFAKPAMRRYHEYVRNLRDGKFKMKPRMKRS